MKIAGIILIVLGALALIYQGFTYTKRRESVSLGPATITAEQKESIPIPPIVGGLALVAGIALVIAGSRRRA